MSKLLFAICFFCVVLNANARLFGRCDLANELLQHDISKDDILDYVCIAEFESSFNTEAINHSNVDGSSDWGLFQINDRYWCNSGTNSANVCGVNCNEFLSDDIGAALRCAERVKLDHGLSAWVAWRNHCQGNTPSKQETAKCL